jgi:ATP-binding cassette, subfamily B (MDR/TAP), member 1
MLFKDKSVEKDHEDSAQLACEAAGSIRTVASLTREDDCLRSYSHALEVPLQRAKRSSMWSNLIYSVSQSLSFFVLALVYV